MLQPSNTHDCKRSTSVTSTYLILAPNSSFSNVDVETLKSHASGALVVVLILCQKLQFYNHYIIVEFNEISYQVRRYLPPTQPD